MSTPLLALIDCNNFFVSCERIFRPDLEGKPVVVLSSNDGCAVARSNEAKLLGIPMGAPVFKYQQLFKDQAVHQFSANFELYGDISDRITRLLTAVTPRIEVYSVDESFLDLSHLNITDYDAWGKLIRDRILREVGVPVSIGIAPSKTLAKLASEIAKKNLDCGGVYDFAHMEQTELEARLARTEVAEIWGVGWKLAPKLKAEGVFTALALAQMSPQRAQQLMGIRGRQMVNELNGLSCYPLHPAHAVRKSLMHGRTLGEDTSNISVLESAVANLTAKATFRLRASGLVTRSATLSLSTSRFKPNFEHRSHFITFATPMADTGVIAKSLIQTLRSVYDSHQKYHRINILFYDLVAADAVQGDLFGDVDLNGATTSQARMQALDAINTKFGNRTIRYAAEDLTKAWEPKHLLRSPRYTTN